MFAFLFFSVLRYSRGTTTPWHFLWQQPKEKVSARCRAEGESDEDFQGARPRSVEKAVVFALFNATLDCKSPSV